MPMFALAAAAQSALAEKNFVTSVKDSAVKQSDVGDDDSYDVRHFGGPVECSLFLSRLCVVGFTPGLEPRGREWD